MSKLNNIFVPAGFRLSVFSDAVSKGSMWQSHNPGEPSTNYRDIAYSQTIVFDAVNENRNFTIKSDQGEIGHEVDFYYIDGNDNLISNLVDVQITDILDGDILEWDDATEKFVNVLNSGGGGGASSLDELTDVDLSSVEDKDALIYDNNLGLWINRSLVMSDISDFSISGFTIDDLADVTVAAPSNGQTLIYSSGVWINSSYDYNNLTNKPSLATQYTDEMAQDATASLIQNGTGISWAYNDVSNTLTPTISLSSFSTTNLSEGANLYYTSARFNTAFSGKSTTDLAEGTNLYYTVTRFNTAFSTKTTSDLAEGTNLYYTDERVDDRVNSLWINGTYISKTYSDAGNTFKVDLSASGTPNGTKFLRDDNTWAVPTQAASGTTIIYPKGATDTWMIAPGNTYVPATTADQSIGSTSNVYFVPFLVTQQTVFSDIACLNGTTSSGNILLGVFESDSSTRLPTGSPLKQGVAALGGTNNAAAIYTFASTLTLAPGLYYLACQVSSAGTNIKRSSVAQGVFIPAFTTFSGSNAAAKYCQYISTLTAYSGTFPSLSGATFSVSTSQLLLALKID